MKQARFARPLVVLIGAVGFTLAAPPTHPLAKQATTAPSREIVTQYNGRSVVAGRVLLKFKVPPAATRLTAVADSMSATYFKPLGGAGWYRLDSSSLSVAQLIQRLAANDGVAKVEPDYVGKSDLAESVRPSAHGSRMMFDLPDDPFYPLQWAYENTGQTVNGIVGTPGADINAPAAWTLANGSTGVVLVDFDTGIDYNNPDLASNVWTAPAAYTITEGGTVYDCPQGSHGFNAITGSLGCAGQEYDNGADYGHGTLTAGVMGAVGDNDLGVAGTDWQATILAISICGTNCAASDAVTGIDGALQIGGRFYLRLVAGNMSHGNIGGSALQDEMNLAGQEGMIFAASTGNECSSSPDDPASFHLNNEIAVSASDQFDNRAYFDPPGNCSNGGGDIAAPGSNIYTTLLGDNGSNPGFASGTSLSAPFVTGAIGLLASACPLPPQVIIGTLEFTADEIPALTGIATDGRRLNLGNAIASCAGTGHTAGTGTIHIHFANSFPADFGYFNVSVAGISSSYPYDTSSDTLDSVSQGVADSISSVYVTATYQGSGVISITTTALGPYTGYGVDASVENDCDPPGDCGKPPSISGTVLTAGH